MLTNKRLAPLQVQIGDGADGAPGTPTLGGAKLRHQIHAHHTFTDTLELPMPATAVSSPRRAKRKLRSYRVWHTLEGLARQQGTKRRLASAFFISLLVGAFFLDLEFPTTVFFQSSHKTLSKHQDHESALAGMGYLWGRGNRPMSELIIAHVSAACQPESLQLFLRSVKHSGVQDRADLVLLMSANAARSQVVSAEERDYQRVKAGLVEAWFRQTEAAKVEVKRRSRSLLEAESKEVATDGDATSMGRNSETDLQQTGGQGTGEMKTPDLDPESKSGAKLNELANTADTGSVVTVDEGSIQRAALTGSSLKDDASIRIVQAVPSPVAPAPLVVANLDEDLRSYVWGDNNRTALAEHLDAFLAADSPTWGATASFSVDELDLLGGLEGFMEPVPERLRRWVAYQTLLGRLRHRYKHVFLTEVDDSVILGDALGTVRVRNGLYLTASDLPWKTVDPSDPEGRSVMNGTYGNRWWQALDPNEHNTPLVDEGAIMGSMKSVRALADAVVNEAVRVSLQRRDRAPLSDQALLSNLEYKSALMQDKKFEPMQLVSNRDSVVHSMPGSVAAANAGTGTGTERVFTNAAGDDYAILHRFDAEAPFQKDRTITSVLRARLCEDNIRLWHHQDCL